MKKACCLFLTLSIGWCVLPAMSAPGQGLRITDCTFAPAVLCCGDTLTVMYTISNEAAVAQKVGLDAALLADETEWRDQDHAKMVVVPPGVSSFARLFVVPEAASSRNYHLLAGICQGRLEVDRRITSNGIGIVSPFDLDVILANGDLAVCIGDSLTIRCTVANQGLAACPSFKLNYRLIAPQGGMEYWLGETQYGRLCPAYAASGCAIQDVVFTAALPAYQVAGTYNLEVTVDSDQRIWERQKLNNRVSRAVQVREPELLAQVARTTTVDEYDSSATKLEMAFMYRELGRLALLAFRPQEAMMYLFNSLTLDPDNTETKQVLAVVYALRAKEYLDANRTDYAQRFWALAQNVDPNFNLADIPELLSNSTRLAVEDKVDAMVDELVLTYCAVARACLAEHEVAQAQLYFQRALELVPACAAARDGLELMDQRQY
jgi:tetratricopeptide (TPR) repeat protein